MEQVFVIEDSVCMDYWKQNSCFVMCVVYGTDMSNQNSLLGQLCHHLNDGRTLNDLWF